MVSPNTVPFSSPHAPYSHIPVLQLTSCGQRREASACSTFTAPYTPPLGQGSCSQQPNKGEQGKRGRAHNILGRATADLGFCFSGQHIALWFILHGLCLHTSVNMVPISLCNSSYKLYVGSVWLFSSHKRFGKNY